MPCPNTPYPIMPQIQQNFDYFEQNHIHSWINKYSQMNYPYHIHSLQTDICGCLYCGDSYMWSYSNCKENLLFSYGYSIWYPHIFHIINKCPTQMFAKIQNLILCRYHNPFLLNTLSPWHKHTHTQKQEEKDNSHFEWINALPVATHSQPASQPNTGQYHNVYKF